MTLRIPRNSRLTMCEFVCENDHEFYVSAPEGEKLKCPWCNKESWNNGMFTTYDAKEANE